MNLEGKTKFQVRHETCVCCRESDVVELTKWRNKFKAAGLVGQDATKYGGLGFGNLSKRMPDGTFLITACQTGLQENLTPDEYVTITAFDPSQNLVCSKGMRHASSETMTHLAVYDSNQGVRFVFHVHSPEIWTARDNLGLPTTSPDVECGTVEMNSEVRQLLKEREYFQKGVLAMGGHADGILAWGETADETGFNLLSLLLQTTRLIPRATS